MRSIRLTSVNTSKISTLKAEIDRLKRSSTPVVPRTSTFPSSGVPAIKRPDFISRFKPNFATGTSTIPKTPIHTVADIRPTTPTFSEKKPTNPFSKVSDTYRTPTRPSRPASSRKGLDIPGSIMRHPQLTKTPVRASPKPPFQLLRPPKSAPVFH